MNQKMVPCVSGKCRATNHVSGSREHARCYEMVAQKNGGAVTGQPPKQDFSSGGVDDIPPPVPKNYDPEDRDDSHRIMDDYETLAMGEYADDSELQELSDWVADYGSPDEVIQFADRFEYRVDIGPLEDAVMDRGNAGDKVRFAYNVNGSDVNALCQSALDEEPYDDYDSNLSVFLTNTAIIDENRQKVYERIKDSTDASIQFILINSYKDVDADHALERVCAAENPSTYWVKAFTGACRNPDIPRLTEVMCRGLDNEQGPRWSSYVAIRNFAEDFDVSAADAEKLLDSLDRSWEKVKSRKTQTLVYIGMPYYDDARDMLKRIISRG